MKLLRNRNRLVATLYGAYKVSNGVEPRCIIAHDVDSAVNWAYNHRSANFLPRRVGVCLHFTGSGTSKGKDSAVVSDVVLDDVTLK
jgi:hypothetical protein